VTTLVFSLAMPDSQTQPTTHTEYPHTPTDGHALQTHHEISGKAHVFNLAPGALRLRPRGGAYSALVWR